MDCMGTACLFIFVFNNFLHLYIDAIGNCIHAYINIYVYDEWSPWMNRIYNVKVKILKTPIFLNKIFFIYDIH